MAELWDEILHCKITNYYNIFQNFTDFCIATSEESAICVRAVTHRRPNRGTVVQIVPATFIKD